VSSEVKECKLSTVLDATPMLDPFEQNPFLSQLLAGGAPAEEPELALRVELTFLALRIAQLRRIDAVLAAGRGVVTDWALFKQPIFAATTLDPADTACVADTMQLWVGSLPTPDLLIGLSAPASVLRRRVRQRGRDLEAGLTGIQLEALSAAFAHAYTRWDGPLIRLDTTGFDVSTTTTFMS
jgi:deoxyadenosine/deoxycytidine kinase